MRRKRVTGGASIGSAFAYLLLGPQFLLLLLVYGGPVGYLCWLALLKTDFIARKWVGLENFVRLVTEPVFWRVVEYRIVRATDRTGIYRFGSDNGIACLRSSSGFAELSADDSLSADVDGGAYHRDGMAVDLASLGRLGELVVVASWTGPRLVAGWETVGHLRHICQPDCRERRISDHGFPRGNPGGWQRTVGRRTY